MFAVNCVVFIDNGVTGTIGVIASDGYKNFILTPVKKEQDYTKAKKNISRINVPVLYQILKELSDRYDKSIAVFLERPLINPKLFNASISASRSMEATVTILEALGIGYQFVDSKEWQKYELPKGTKGTAELKKASMDIGARKYPQFAGLIHKHKDADGILGAERFFREVNGL